MTADQERNLILLGIFLVLFVTALVSMVNG